MFGAFRFHFLGTVGVDAKTVKMQNGNPRTVVSVAVNTPEKKDGEWKDRTTWVQVAFFGESANRASITSLKKGMAVYVDGSVQSYTEEIEGGKKRTMYNFRPDVIRRIGHIERDNGGGRAQDSNDFPAEDEVY